jgi:hypothetical protein
MTPQHKEYTQMGSNRLRLLLVSMMAVFAISAVASASASAATCYKVAVPKTGNFEKMNATTGKCEKAVVEGEYVETKKVTDLNNGKGELCAEVAAGTGTFETLATCEAGKPPAKGNFIRVLENEGEQQFFQNGKNEEPLLKGLMSANETGKASVLRASVNTVECEKNTDTGKLVGRESVEKVTVTFTKCKGKNSKTSKTCTVKSKGATGAEEIVTNSLKGELGEIETGSEVGLLLEPSTGVLFVTLEGSCLEPTTAAIEGGIIGEVTPLTKGLKDKVIYALNGTAQKITKFERSFANHCALAKAIKCEKPDQTGTTSLKFAGTIAATQETTDVNTFEEELEINKGS